MTEKRKVAIYCRVSTELQRKEVGGSLETQENRCRKWCAEKGYTLTKVYKDVASGSSLKRTQIQQLFDDAAAGKFDLIIITKMDRFTRSLQDFFTKLRDLQAWNVGIVAIDQPELSTEGPTGKLLRAVILAIAEFERDLIRQRTSEGIRAKIARGEWKGGAPPYGYAIKDRMLQIVEEEAAVIRSIFSDYINRKSNLDITEDLNAKGIRKRSGRKWTVSAIWYILQNPTYAGKFHNPENQTQLIEGLHAPVISMDDFNKARTITTAARKNHYIHKILPNEMLFGSILRCGHCNSAMSPHKANKGRKIHRYYRCQNAQKRGAKSCPVGQISSVDIEAIGVSLVRLLSSDDKLLQSILSEASSDQQSKIGTLQDQRAEIEKRIADLENKTNKWMTNFEDSDDVDLVEVISKRVSTYSESIKEMQSTIEEINGKIEKLKQPIENLEGLVASYHYFWNLWQDMSTTERQQLIRTLIKEMRLYKDSAKKYRLEIDLLSDVTTNSSTSGQGGGATRVCTLTGKSTPGRNRTYAPGSGGQSSIH